MRACLCHLAIPLMLHGLALAQGAAQQPAPRDLARILDRISRDAESFRKVAPETLSEETLEQRSRPGSVELLDQDAAVGKLAAAVFHHREVVSEYGYAGMQNAPGALHEFRKVIRIDGRQISTVEQARHAMTLGLVSPGDQQRKRFLEDFEKHGLKGAVTDFGQLILLFSRRGIKNYDFRFSRETRVGVDSVLVLAYKQVGGPEALTVFRGKTAVRQPLEGEIWVRESDGLPLRVTLDSAQQMKHNTIRDEAAVDYWPSPFGTILPVSVQHREYLNDNLLTENVFRYAPFRRFTATAKLVATDASGSPEAPAQTVISPATAKPSTARQALRAPADNIPVVKAPVIRLPQ